MTLTIIFTALFAAAFLWMWVELRDLDWERCERRERESAGRMETLRTRHVLAEAITRKWKDRLRDMPDSELRAEIFNAEQAVKGFYQASPGERNALVFQTQPALENLGLLYAEEFRRRPPASLEAEGRWEVPAELKPGAANG